MTRRASQPGPRILANSFPKAGTFLLDRCLGLLPGLENLYEGVCIYGWRGSRGLDRRRRYLSGLGGGLFLQAHLPFSTEAARLVEEHGVKHVLIIRDPRDVVVSFVRFHLRRPDLEHHDRLTSLPDMGTRIDAVLRGHLAHEPGRDFADKFGSFLPWMDHGCLLVTFEDLVGPRGGGTAERQLRSLARLASFVGIELDEATLHGVADGLFDPRARTFSRGQIGDWRSCFSAANIETFSEVCGDLLVRLGYEDDDLWATGHLDGPGEECP